MFDRWTAAETYYSHGFLVPVICIFLVWKKRREFSALTPASDKLGWVLFIIGIIIHFFSSLWQVYFSSGFSIIFVISGLVLLYFGREYMRKVLFPVMFLGFMIPLPLVAISNISFRLKIIASQAAVFFVNIIGMPAVREGSVIKTAHSSLVVEDPCSGIRSLIALIALGCLMAYLSKSVRWKKAILFLSSIPIAIFANVIRIVVLTLVGEMYGTQFATGMFHDIMGFVVFVIAFAFLKLVYRLIE